VNDRRPVRVNEAFFRRLDELLPPQRTAAGAPSGTDFLLHDMPRIIDRLADDFETATLPVDEEPRIRMLIASGSLVAFIVVYATLAADGAVEILSLELEL
jgi:hypothetical protein